PHSATPLTRSPKGERFPAGSLSTHFARVLIVICHKHLQSTAGGLVYGYCDREQVQAEGLPPRRPGGDPADRGDRADEGWVVHPRHSEREADPGRSPRRGSRPAREGGARPARAQGGG